LLSAACAAAADDEVAEVAEVRSLELLGRPIDPGVRLHLDLVVSESFEGVAISTPIIVSRGVKPGPTLCLTAGVHGDELIGVEIVRRVMESVDPSELSGALIGVPIANPHGFRRSSRYLPDRRDLNRYFPGKARGSSASRIAHTLFDNVILRCDFLVDFHTGSFFRRNIPQIRADLRNLAVDGLSRRFGAPVVVHSTGQIGTLRRAATDTGIPAITFEAGEPMRFDDNDIQDGVLGVRHLLASLEMTPGRTRRGSPEVFLERHWIRVDDGGIFRAALSLGDSVAVGDVLGTVTDPFTNDRVEVTSRFAGRIIGMALDQVVIPGFAAFHIGVHASVPSEDPNVSAPPAVPSVVDGELELELEERPE
jgi:predicted deacylase